MRYDSIIGWLLTKEEYVRAGFSTDQYNKERQRGNIATISRSCKNVKAEIIFKDLPERIKSVLMQKFINLGDDHQQYMAESAAAGMEMTEMAIAVTAQSININVQFVVKELSNYIEKNYHQYLSYYIENSNNGERRLNSVIGYAKICALAIWLHGMVMKIMQNHTEKRDQNRMLSSLRANVMSVIETINFSVKVPNNDIRFAQWLENVVFQLNQGKPVTEVVKFKREGNANTRKLDNHQGNWIVSMYVLGNSMSIQEIYDRMVEVGRFKNWWRNKETGDYEPVVYGTVYCWIKQHYNQLQIERTDAISYYNRFVAQTTREYPKKRNECWGIDGTAHNENVFYKGQVKQYMYAIKIYDYASCYLIHNEITIGMDESAFRVIEAVKGAVKAAGYLPAYLQCDRGPGYEALKKFCAEVGITIFPAGSGRARSKVIESLIGQFEGGVKFEKGWSGMNRTAQGLNSHPSDAYFKKGKSNARSLEMASRDLRTRLTDQWNNHIIKTRGGEKYDKTPAELWNSLESETCPLPYTELSMLAGAKHTVKMSIAGAEVQHENIKYLYFPQIDTEEQRIKADKILASIPLYQKESSLCDLYILSYGKPAPVFCQKRYMGTWTLKSKAPYLAGHHHNTETLVNMNDLQKKQIASAKNFCKESTDRIKNGPDAQLFEQMGSTAYVGRTRITGKYDKAEFNASEVMEKALIDTPDPVTELKNELESVTTVPQFKQLVDPDDGEIYLIPINILPHEKTNVSSAVAVQGKTELTQGKQRLEK